MFSSLTSSCAQRPQRYDILRAVLIRVAVRRGLREQATERVVHRTGNLYVFVRDDINLFHINDVRVDLAVHAYVKKSAAAAARPGSKTKELEPPVVAAAFHMARIQDQSQVVS